MDEEFNFKTYLTGTVRFYHQKLHQDPYEILLDH